MTRRFRRTERGFTLVELMVAVALSGVELLQFLVALFALGVGRNFLTVTRSMRF